MNRLMKALLGIKKEGIKPSFAPPLCYVCPKGHVSTRAHFDSNLKPHCKQDGRIMKREEPCLSWGT